MLDHNLCLFLGMGPTLPAPKRINPHRYRFFCLHLLYLPPVGQEGNTPGQFAEQQDNRKCAQLLQSHQTQSADREEDLPRFQYCKELDHELDFKLVILVLNVLTLFESM